MDPENEKKFLDLLKSSSNPLETRDFLLNNSFLSDCLFIIGTNFPPEIFYGEFFQKI
jgi:hypothetical protein